MLHLGIMPDNVSAKGEQGSQGEQGSDGWSAIRPAT
jgi:hypothetical protein